MHSVFPRAGASNVTVTHYGPRRTVTADIAPVPGRRAGGRDARRGERGREDDGGSMNDRARRLHGRQGSSPRDAPPNSAASVTSCPAPGTGCRFSMQPTAVPDRRRRRVSHGRRPGRIAPCRYSPRRTARQLHGGAIRFCPVGAGRQPGARESACPSPTGAAWRRLAAKLRGVFRRPKNAPIPNPPSSLRCPHMRPGPRRAQRRGREKA